MDDWKKWGHRMGLLGAGLLAFGFPVLWIYRAASIWHLVAHATGRSEPVYWTILHQDAVLVGSVLLLLYLGVFSPRFNRLRLLGYIARLGAFLITLAYCVDLWLTLNLFKRLYYRDVLEYGPELRSGWNLVEASLPDWLQATAPAVVVFGIVTGALVLLVAFLALRPAEQTSPRHTRILLGVSIGLLLIGLLPIESIDRPGALYSNLIRYNLPKSVERSYSAAFARRLDRRVSPEKKRLAGQEAHPDIIVLIVESLSASHSRFFSGVNDYTPNLDEIARNHIGLVNFFANGPATEHGLIALLTGRVPLPGPDTEIDAFQCFYQQPSLATVLSRVGYTPMFFTTGDLSFTDKRRWLENIGFQKIAGHDAPFYETWPRFHFKAAPDQALYAYALRQIHGLNASQDPFFMVLETVSSHLPYKNPSGEADTEELVFRYVDRELGRFYRALAQMDFFRDGILIIVGDHRVMAPLSAAERKRFGESAFARIPLVVAAGKSRRGRIEDAFQQTDLLPSLQGLVAKDVFVDPWHGSFLHRPPVAPDCILVPLTDDPDLVYVRCGASEGYIKLDGDDTRLVSGRIPQRILPDLIDHINRSRLNLCRQGVP